MTITDKNLFRHAPPRLSRILISARARARNWKVFPKPSSLSCCLRAVRWIPASWRPVCLGAEEKRRKRVARMQGRANRPFPRPSPAEEFIQGHVQEQRPVRVYSLLMSPMNDPEIRLMRDEIRRGIPPPEPGPMGALFLAVIPYIWILGAAALIFTALDRATQYPHHLHAESAVLLRIREIHRVWRSRSRSGRPKITEECWPRSSS